MDRPKCTHCKFYEPMQGSADVGTCRRFPPTLMFVAVQAPNLAGQTELRWPSASNHVPVQNDGWCGEFTPGLAIQN